MLNMQKFLAWLVPVLAIGLFFDRGTFASPLALSYPPKGYHLAASQPSPKNTFRVETYEDAKDSDLDDGALRCVWVVPKERTHAAWRLVGPETPSQLYPVEVFISPDEDWIRWEQKLSHHVDAASLFERTAGFRYKELGPPIFSEQAWRFMGEQTHRSFTTTDADDTIRLSDWPRPGSRKRKLGLYDDRQAMLTAPNDHSLLVALNGDDGTTQVRFWYCFYDLEQHRFYITTALRKRNRGRVSPSRDR